MKDFEYTAPNTVEEALGLLAAEWGKADILAGGTDQINLMKDGVHTPERLVSLKNVKSLRGIESGEDGLRIGAMATIEDLLGHSAVREKYPALAQAAEGISSPQIRAMGAVGGDLLQRPRCWYFRNGFGLLATGENGKSLVVNGENRYHAILGNKGPAYFVNASSLAPALIAYGAKVKVASADGERELAVEDLYRIPESGDEREITLAPNELLTEIHVPPAGASATYEVRERQLLDWPLTAAAVALKMSGGKVDSARVVMGHVAPIPWRSPEVERQIKGKAIDEKTADAAGEAAVAKAAPLSQNKHKVRLARVAVKRALLAAAGKEV